MPSASMKSQRKPQVNCEEEIESHGSDEVKSHVLRQEVEEMDVGSTAAFRSFSAAVSPGWVLAAPLLTRRKTAREDSAHFIVDVGEEGRCEIYCSGEAPFS